MDLVFGARALWIQVVTSVALAIPADEDGHRPQGSAGRSAHADLDDGPAVLVYAFRDAKLIGKDETLRWSNALPAWATAGRSLSIYLPPARQPTSSSTATRWHRPSRSMRCSSLWSGCAARADTPGVCSCGWPTKTPMPVRLADTAAGRRVVGRLAAGPVRPRRPERRIDLPLVWTSLLVGAIPRQGKTFAARLAAAGLILDPYTRLYVFDGKGGKDWERPSRWPTGSSAATNSITPKRSAILCRTGGGGPARFARMATLDDEICPESKITPAISRDMRLGMPITAVIIDEVQVSLETPRQIGGKKTTLGEYIADLLPTWSERDQRPDRGHPRHPTAGLEHVPVSLAGGARFSFRTAVMDWRDSNIVLGEQMNTRGYDSSTLLPTHKGVGILRPDGETDAGADMLALTVRTYYMPNAEWRAICARGRSLREAAGTLVGHAAGDDTARAIDHASVANALDRRQVGTSSEPRQRRPTPCEPAGTFGVRCGLSRRRDRGTRVHPYERTGRGAGRRADLVRPTDARSGVSVGPQLRTPAGWDGPARTRLLHRRDPSRDRRRTRGSADDEPEDADDLESPVNAIRQPPQPVPTGQ